MDVKRVLQAFDNGGYPNCKLKVIRAGVLAMLIEW